MILKKKEKMKKYEIIEICEYKKRVVTSCECDVQKKFFQQPTNDFLIVDCVL